METAVFLDHLTTVDQMVAAADLPPDPFERQVVGAVALELAGDLIAFVQRLNAERAPYVTTYTVEERLAHRRADLEPPKDRPQPQPDPEPEPEPEPTPPAEGE